MPRVRGDLELQVVTEVEPTGLLKAREHLVGTTHHPQVDVLRRPRSFEAKLDHQPTFQDDRVFENAKQARQEAVKDKELAPTLQVHLRRSGLGPKSLLDGGLECEGGGVASRLHESSSSNDRRYSEAGSIIAVVNRPR